MTGNNIKNKKGFSLMEIIVALGIFGFVGTISLAIFINVVKSQQLTLAAQSVQEGVRYALEMMSKEVRSAKSNFNGNNCIGDTSNKLKIYEVGVDRSQIADENIIKVTGKSLVFRDKDGFCTSYRIASGQLQIWKDANGNNLVDAGETFPITSNDLTVTDLLFTIVGTKNGVVKNIQDMVTISIGLESNGPMDYNTRIQTTISSRRYN